MKDFANLARAGGASLIAALALASCTVVVDEGPRPLPPDRPQFCTREYDPVCARDGRDVRTFGNACSARAEGYRILYPGECRRGGPNRPPPPQFCTQQYDPVCARRGRDVRTFGNACEARADRYRILYEGRCARG